MSNGYYTKWQVLISIQSSSFGPVPRDSSQFPNNGRLSRLGLWLCTSCSSWKDLPPLPYESRLPWAWDLAHLGGSEEEMPLVSSFYHQLKRAFFYLLSLTITTVGLTTVGNKEKQGLGRLYAGWRMFTFDQISLVQKTNNKNPAQSLADLECCLVKCLGLWFWPNSQLYQLDFAVNNPLSTMVCGVRVQDFKFWQ